jgi:hypothetical protein
VTGCRARELDPATLKDRIRIASVAAAGADSGDPEPPALEFATSYDRAARAIEIRPSSGWPRVRQVTVSFHDGIRPADGGSLPPFTLAFSTGGLQCPA